MLRYVDDKLLINNLYLDSPLGGVSCDMESFYSFVKGESVSEKRL